MIPLRDVIPSRTSPYVTVTIIILNALAWFYEVSMPREQLSVFLQQFGVVPAAFSIPTLFTSMFLHGSWSHAPTVSPSTRGGSTTFPAGRAGPRCHWQLIVRSTFASSILRAGVIA